MRELNVVEASWSMDAAGSWLKLRPELPGQAKMVAGEFDPQKKYVVTIKELRKMRSLDANRYLWVTLCNKCHEDFDQTAKRKHMQAYIRRYLKMKYPDWDETKLIYKKGT